MPYCNLACSWCDTSFNSHQEWSADRLLEFAEREPTRFAVITGGEPTMHKHTPKVISYLKAKGFELAIETNGHFPIPAGIDWVCCSPKRDQYMQREPYYINPVTYDRVAEFKYVVDDAFDFSVLGRHAADNAGLSRGSPLSIRHWLSPEHTNWRRNVDRILEFVAANPMWRLNLQTHKLIGVP
jgi:organic radical activating enzyme